MLIQTHHERHQTTTPSIATTSTTRRTRAAKRAAHRIPSTTVGTSYRMAGRAAAIRARLPMPFDAEDRPPSPLAGHAARDMTSFADGFDYIDNRR
jgi:hypothetical protein